MLVEIAKPLSADTSVVRLHPLDNVAIALAPIPAGTELRVAGAALTAREAIPAGHKMALREIAGGEMVIRYGQSIGPATGAIAAGSHVHGHNLGYQEPQTEYEFPEDQTGQTFSPPGSPAPPLSRPMAAGREDGGLPAPEPGQARSFLGYLRSDGRVGTRNYIAVAAASNCAAHTVERIARSYEDETLPDGVDGVVAFPHGEGCGHAAGPDVRLLQRTLRGVLNHPNVSAALIVGLGCEDNQIEHYLGEPGGGGRIAGLTLQESGGTRGAVEAARREIARFIERAAEEKRTPAPASKIVLGLNCGGSDSFSGITANPALGYCSDLLAGLGGSAVLAETPEIFGAEHLLVKRARNRAVAERLLGFIREFRRYLGRFDGTFDDNPSPGNKAGGLTNILEKSLGAVAKGGTSKLMEVYDYAEEVTSPGLVFMNTPGYDPVSLAGLAAGGCNLIAFTTGRGSAIGFPTIPVIKIASNSATYRRMRDNMDVDAGAIAGGGKSVEQAGREIFDLVLETASGRRSCAERLGHKEFVPWRIGPVV